MKFSITEHNLDKYSNVCIISGTFEKLNLFPSTIKMNEISKGYIELILKKISISQSTTQPILLYDIPNLPNRQLILINCGEKNKFNLHCYKQIIHQVALLLKEQPIIYKKILFLLSEININTNETKHNNYWKIRKTIEIINDELYIFNEFKNIHEISFKKLDEIILYIPDSNKLQNCNNSQAIKEGISISNGVNTVKKLGNLPPNVCTPDYLISQVQKLSCYHDKIDIDILHESKMQELGMNAYLAVGQGSKFPVSMPIIKYQGHPNSKQYPPIVLIGKGITFDSGGISIKPSERMDEMKFDMCGAGAVYAILQIVAELNLPLNIIGILAICENMISNTSLRPGDILTTLSGQTVEVLNTDAEGRLVLCDALTYAERYNPSIVIDIATLTGACVTALGHIYSGLMSNNKNLIDDIILASKQSGDYVWQLPLNEEFHKQLKSTCADMKNIGNKSGSVIVAGCFLQKFAQKYNWAHLDIAGTAWRSNYKDKSATGRPVALLSQFLLNKI